MQKTACNDQQSFLLVHVLKVHVKTSWFFVSWLHITVGFQFCWEFFIGITAALVESLQKLCKILKHMENPAHTIFSVLIHIRDCI